ncbi:glucosamine 6-phosphate N-acetyltransferase [Nymphaea colorata]|uniref:Glucosamine 6-phosphate N-acetyltransferase n=1 Tax=Nymphaea colorata TaxID=210225 RepID=A0A5K1EPE6_9MAGN|nr:glucosamine 6-phosphate N-acetyltransferase [Nymphaea colorata]XP_031487871.1 glucosamine 6-phosphate N-acetyltransferase [Nymphaea colorata]XP_031487872.1 glucosamine 6-phosphate N-acetyltransferase [Nymphaea colorata]XP_031487873.1 glucosamine 6-phosphate N-acetyltransferase [Nymphaea colorata]XP_031487874.1 glucosamine 6-phosphate N-acetyltransferase [Nymphaea colorata]XP_031487875.1 glucosamine 6-phosphate N-acetyltransferase [Nymphaea colorata]XP_031487876.1 glucosamine 6-phosphate N-
MEEGAESRFLVRRLEVSDYEKGFISLLSQLTICPPISFDEFRSRFMEIEALGDNHVICVVEDTEQGRLVATGSIFVERKFLRGCGKVGHIEDVVVDSAARGMRLGQRVVGFLSNHARSVGCYKVILDCSPDNRGFYERCGFVQKELQMAVYFNPLPPSS